MISVATTLEVVGGHSKPSVATDQDGVMSLISAFREFNDTILKRTRGTGLARTRQHFKQRSKVVA